MYRKNIVKIWIKVFLTSSFIHFLCLSVFFVYLFFLEQKDLTLIPEVLGASPLSSAFLKDTKTNIKWNRRQHFGGSPVGGWDMMLQLNGSKWLSKHLPTVVDIMHERV